jgi:predicted membrane-bound dolichyl-phosphate-mannose-protein mannosyltransferase
LGFRVIDLSRLKNTLNKAAPYILLLLVLAYAAHLYFGLALNLQELEKQRKGKGYVSDEVWYVPSARNILIKVFGITPRKPGTIGASIIFQGKIPYEDVSRIASKYNVKIIDTNYYHIRAIYVEAPNTTDIEVFVKALNESKIRISDIVYGWRIPDATGINQYLNLEHPPMAKYLIGLSIMLLGDYPVAWRIPEIAAGIIMLVALFYLAIDVVEGSIGRWLALIIVFLTAIDPIMRALSSIALLDIYVALFTVLAFIPLSRRHYLLSLLVAIVGSTFKFSVLFAIIPIYILFIRSRLKRDPGFANFIYTSILFLAVTVALFLAAQIIVSIPLIGYLGFKSWFSQSIIGAIEWHTSVKCVGAGCPPVSTPLDWFVGVNSFPLYYMSGNQPLLAQGYWPLWIVSLATLIIFLPGYMISRSFGKSFLYLVGTWSGYVILWLIGGRTQYSFYSVQFVGLVYLALIVSIYEMMILWYNGRRALKFWISLFKWLWKVILRLLMVRE